MPTSSHNTRKVEITSYEVEINNSHREKLQDAHKSTGWSCKNDTKVSFED